MSYPTFLVLTIVALAASSIALFFGDALSRPVAAFMIGYLIAQLISTTTP